MILILFHSFKLELDRVLTVLPNRSNKLKSHINPSLNSTYFSSDFQKNGSGALSVTEEGRYCAKF